MAKRRQPSKRTQRNIIKVIGEIPSMRSQEERKRLLSQIDGYFPRDAVLHLCVTHHLLTPREYQKLESMIAERYGLAKNSIIRNVIAEHEKSSS